LSCRQETLPAAAIRKTPRHELSLDSTCIWKMIKKRKCRKRNWTPAQSPQPTKSNRPWSREEGGWELGIAIFGSQIPSTFVWCPLTVSPVLQSHRIPGCGPSSGGAAERLSGLLEPLSSTCSKCPKLSKMSVQTVRGATFMARRWQRQSWLHSLLKTKVSANEMGHFGRGNRPKDTWYLKGFVA